MDLKGSGSQLVHSGPLYNVTVHFASDAAIVAFKVNSLAGPEGRFGACQGG